MQISVVPQPLPEKSCVLPETAACDAKGIAKTAVSAASVISVFGFFIVYVTC
jgi:hypothetical protein